MYPCFKKARQANIIVYMISNKVGCLLSNPAKLVDEEVGTWVYDWIPDAFNNYSEEVVLPVKIFNKINFKETDYYVRI